MITILFEKLEPAVREHFRILQKQIDTDPETAKMLTTPMDEIPQYKWLYLEEDIYKFIRVMPLFNALVAMATIPKIKLEFSVVGTKLTGFLSYQEAGSEITAIKMASFKDDKSRTNPVLAVDLAGFLDKESRRRTKITWLAHVANQTAVKQYDKLLNSKKFVWSKDYLDKTKKMWIYTFTGKR